MGHDDVAATHGLLALSLSEQVEKIGEARNDVAVQLEGRRANGLTRCHLGEFVAARAILERCHGLSDPARSAVGLALSDPYAAMLANLALTLAFLGYIDQARLRLNEALSEARQLRHAATLAFVFLHAGWVAWITGTPDMQDEFLAVSTEHGFPHFLGWATVGRGWSLTTLGRAQEGLPLLTQALTELDAIGAVVNRPLVLIMLAEANAKLGHVEAGLSHLADAAQIIEATDERCNEAELHRLRGELLIATGDQSAAEESYLHALGVAQRQSAKLFELRASTSLARLWRDQGKRTEARDLLAPIYGWFTEGFDTPDLKEAKALLTQFN
jgi:predicted ATPase